MKILSIVTVGGRHIKWLGLYMIFMLSVQSCDMGFTLPLDNNKFSYDFSLSEDSMVKVSSMYFNGWHYLLFDLKGEYVMNPDSLKLEFCDKNIIVGKLLPCSETNTISKSIISNNCHTIWNFDAFERFTRRKSPVSNICYTIWNLDASERFTRRKSFFSNICHTIWNIDTGD